MVTISSCKFREKSYEWPEKGHSAFTYHLLEALKQPAVADADKDGYLSVNELYTKVHQDVRRWAARTRPPLRVGCGEWSVAQACR